MIGLGAQYLTAAGFGRYRITAASLGSLDLLGTWRWLNGVTQQAIMAAFGVDGTAVIAATNEYLNGIAASDKAKATALAGFINEDPMLVMSLIEGLGTRKITPIGNAYFKTGYKANGNTGFYIDFYSKANTSMCIFGGRTAHNNLSYAMTPYTEGSLNGQFYYAGNLGKVQYNAEIYNNNHCIVKYDAATHKFTNAAGTVISTSAQTFTIDYEIYLFADNQKNSMIEHFSGDICVIRFDELGVDKRYYVPFIRNGQNEMLDLSTGQLAERVGSFTISESPA